MPNQTVIVVNEGYPGIWRVLLCIAGSNQRVYIVKKQFKGEDRWKKVANVSTDHFQNKAVQVLNV